MQIMKKTSILLITIIAITNIFGQDYSLQFDGSTTKIEIKDTVVLNPENAITLEAWINADEWANEIYAGSIISKQTSNPDRGYCITVGNNGQVSFTIAQNNTWKSATSASIMGTGSWYHIAGTYDGQNLKVYINGILMDTQTQSGSILTSIGKPLNIGENPEWNGRVFLGKIDEVRIWNIARSENQIKNNMLDTISPNDTNLIAYYNFNSIINDTIFDLSNYKNHGLLKNMDTLNLSAGFSPSPYDVGIKGIVSPTIWGNGFGNNEIIAVEIKNYGTSPIFNFDVTYKIDTVINTEIFTDTIEPFESKEFYFTNTINLEDDSTINIVCYTGLDDDVNNDNDTLMETISKQLSYMIFDSTQHNFGSAGQTHTVTFYMPEDMSKYNEILLKIDLLCPTGGCDPWDQIGKLCLKKDNIQYELARYITPYGKACGGWVFDISHFRDLLTGKVEFISYIQVWGGSGWLVNAELEIIESTPEYPFIRVTKLWNNEDWTYGEPTISHDFDAQNIYISPYTEELKIFVTLTGHGQGNTQNCAEFCNKTHELMLNNNQIYEHHLWKDDCNINSCSPQNGTWEFSRAGWCPGQDVQPKIFDITNDYIPNGINSFDYILEDYVNLNNTNYNEGSHTKPFYRMQAYLVQYMTQWTNDINKITDDKSEILIYPNPTKKYLYIKIPYSNTQTTVNLLDITGKTLISKTVNSETSKITFEQNYKAGIYFLQIINKNNIEIKKVCIIE